MEESNNERKGGDKITCHHEKVSSSPFDVVSDKFRPPNQGGADVRTALEGPSCTFKTYWAEFGKNKSK